MDEIEFTFNGEVRRLTRDQVVRAMRDQVPGQLYTYAVNIDGKLFPAKQVLASALRVPRSSFISTRAQDLLSKLGFEVLNTEEGDRPEPPPAYRDTQLRSTALSLAVANTGSAPNNTDDVLAVADRFADWLAGG
jgi:hypothetical protein